MGLLPFISALSALTHTRARTRPRTHECPSHFSAHTRRGAATPDTCHRLDSEADTHLQTHTFIVSLCHLLLPTRSLFFLSRSDFHVQGQYQASAGSITSSYPEHDKRTNAVTPRTKGRGDVPSAARVAFSHSTSFYFISEPLFNDISLEGRVDLWPSGRRCIIQIQWDVIQHNLKS